MIRTIFIIALAILTTQLFAQPVQTIRGVVLDDASNTPLAFASVKLLQTNPVGTTTDTLGNFSLSDVPVGRYDIQVAFVGYETAIVREVTVTSAKQTYLTIQLKENTTLLGEIVVKPRINKERPLSTTATLSAKMLSVEEAKRYAGGFDDPARLATSIAGVASNTNDNGIIVRGNAPKSLQWKMEGVEIPSPNHFGDLYSLGGGLLTALSSQMLDNSDFLTGAFPAEYNNALSGVFDIAMRTGNNQKREHTLQLGLIGIDASSEGPFKKGNNASYLFNYRYSTLALVGPLLPEGAGGVQYQDLSFKLNFPTKKAGIFSLWGLGFIDGAKSAPKADKNEWKYPDDDQNDVIEQYTGVAGISHKYFFKNNAYLKTTFAATANKVDWTTQKMDEAFTLQPFSKIGNTNLTYILSSVFNKKFSARHTNKTGVVLTGMQYDILLRKAQTVGSAPQDIVKTDGFSSVVAGYSHSSVNLSSKLLMNIGVNAQVFTLNNHYTIEPRVGLKQQINEKHSVGLAYGLHSRLEKLNYYFNNSLSTGETAVNKDLDFSKAHHLIMSYDWNVSDLVHLRVEPYFQSLFSIPVIKDSSFSFMNLQNDLFFGEKLESAGEGRIYGIDISLDKYMSKGYYYLATASLFNSEYKGGDDIWRDTRFNRNYVFNFLIGKEWKMGQNKQNSLSINTRFSYQGANRYSPVHEVASVAAKEVVYDETKAFSMQADPSLNVNFTAIYRINKKGRSSEIALKVLNLTGQTDFRGHLYNRIDNTVDQELPSLIIPNLSYKIEF